MMDAQRLFLRLARAGTLLTLVVVVLGAWVRLTDAGLGCPDWPGCYGRLIPSQIVPEEIDPAHATRPLDTGKAWREMIHRAVAGTLGLIAFAVATLAWLNRRVPGQQRKAALALVPLIVLQALLGMWTVTELLKPIIVVAHLFGGLGTLALFFYLGRWREVFAPSGASYAPAGGVVRPAVGHPAAATVDPKRLSRSRALGIAAAAALVLQIALGGWTSANYAALACPDFPTCQTQWWPEIADFSEGFVLWRGLGIDYEGGVLDHPARVAVHFAHRLGALVAALLLAIFAARLIATPGARADGAAVAVAVAAQLALGVSIVVWGVPLPVAVAHNGMAALLLLTVINANQRIRQS